MGVDFRSADDSTGDIAMTSPSPEPSKEQTELQAATEYAQNNSESDFGFKLLRRGFHAGYAFAAADKDRRIEEQDVELRRLVALNEDKFSTIQAYCKAASADKAELERVRERLQYAGAWLFRIGKNNAAALASGMPDPARGIEYLALSPKHQEQEP